MLTNQSPQQDLEILRPVLDTVLDAVVAMSGDGVVIAWNDVAERTFGWTGAEAIGRSMADLIIPAQHREGHNQGLQRYKATGEERVLGRRIEISALHKDGREFPVELSITTAPSSDDPIFIGFLRDISARHQAAARSRLLVNELNHRVKNMLAIVQSVAAQTFKDEALRPEARQAFESRLAALAAAHDLLTAGNWETASLREVIEKAGIGCGAEAERFRIAGPDLRVQPRTAVSIVMAVHELCTNAVKYGALSNDSGTVAVEWDTADAMLRLRWVEQGGPPVAPPSHRGFGSRMIERGLAADLGGPVKLEFLPQGVRCTVEAPLPKAAQAGA